MSIMESMGKKKPLPRRSFTPQFKAESSVLVDGHVRQPWITWFIDCAYDIICGLATTPQSPSRESILVALRDAILTETTTARSADSPKQSASTAERTSSAPSTELVRRDRPWHPA
jgi:hypothetical protein